MRYGILAVLLAVAVYVFLCGCGTIQNMGSDKQQVYGGVRTDLNTVTASCSRIIALRRRRWWKKS